MIFNNVKALILLIITQVIADYFRLLENNNQPVVYYLTAYLTLIFAGFIILKPDQKSNLLSVCLPFIVLLLFYFGCLALGGEEALIFYAMVNPIGVSLCALVSSSSWLILLITTAIPSFLMYLGILLKANIKKRTHPEGHEGGKSNI